MRIPRSSVLEYPQRHAVSAPEYLRMGEAGVFGPEARLELIEGEIIEMTPIGSPHAGAVKMLTRLLVRMAGDRAVVSVQDPVVLGDRSVPQPDLALLEPRADGYSAAHPTAAEILLAIEVADTTLAFDLGTKVPLYARAAVPEVWVIDVNEQAIRVYRDPSASGYKTSFTVTGQNSVASVALPDVRVVVSNLFPQ
ncbi:MAG TPA: Uma2 family endonuclease [Vicinamibacterales bacterium]|nr:Uma2 family endonuclease [Vicinamibacterales bacterium]